MPEPKRTPGPWRVVASPSKGVSVYDATDCKVAAVYGLPGNEICMAKAALIAAAPDLLAALEHAIGLLDVLATPDDMVVRPFLREARAAVTKAKGE